MARRLNESDSCKVFDFYWVNFKSSLYWSVLFGIGESVGYVVKVNTHFYWIMFKVYFETFLHVLNLILKMKSDLENPKNARMIFLAIGTIGYKTVF